MDEIKSVYDINEAFKRIENELIESMMRNIDKHAKDEAELGIQYEMWQKIQLNNIAEFKKEQEKLLTEKYKEINKKYPAVLAKAYRDGRQAQRSNLEAAKKRGANVKAFTGDELAKISNLNERKLIMLIKAAEEELRAAETSILRVALDKYREVIFNAQVYINTGAGTLRSAIDMATKDFLANGIASIQYKDGRTVGITSYTEMALRTANLRAYMQGEASMRDEYGVRTVIISGGGMACPICARFSGRVFVDNIYSSITDEATLKYPLLSTAVEAGLFHPNCKDTATTFIEGITEAAPMSETEKEEAIRNYNAEQKQRYNERNIRRYKRLHDYSLTEENRERYGAKVHEWQKRQRELLKAEPALRRAYEREKTTWL